ncbi:MAG: hypothetical protein ACPGVB_17640, partial [Chitinophagales bacterium]
MNTTTYQTIATNTASPKLKQEVIDLLQQMISTPSFSREENEVADLMEAFLSERGLKINRKGNNIWVRNDGFEMRKYTILLNS